MSKYALAVLSSICAGSAIAQNSTGEVICSYAPSQSKAVSTVSGAAGGAGAATAAIAQALGLTAVTHSSGALILSGSGGYIAGTLGTAVIAPAIITAGVVIGGTAITVELVCAPKNHPEYSEKIFKAATDFADRMSQIRGGAAIKTSEHIDRVATSFKQVKEDVFEYIYGW